MTTLESKLLRHIERRLSQRADDRRKEWWERYLRGTAKFRGVKMADIRAAAAEAAERFDIAGRRVETGIGLALACMARPASEDKLVGVLLLGEHLLARLRVRHTGALSRPLRRGHLADWNTVDWFCVKCLSPFVGSGSDVEARARRIGGWRRSGLLWQRRAAAVAFVHHVRRKRELFPGFLELLLEVCERNARDPARFSQTSVGWLLREMSHEHPTNVRAFLDAHAGRLSAEALRSARTYL